MFIFASLYHTGR